MSDPAAFDRFAAHVAARFGCRCTTVLRHHAQDAERLYSSDPGFVPAQGRKRFDEAPAMARMKARGKPQAFDGAEALKPMFRDWPMLVESGFACIVNLPLHDGDGTLLGQVNLTLPEGRITAPELAELARMAQELAPALRAR